MSVIISLAANLNPDKLSNILSAILKISHIEQMPDVAGCMRFKLTALNKHKLLATSLAQMLDAENMGVLTLNATNNQDDNFKIMQQSVAEDEQLVFYEENSYQANDNAHMLTNVTASSAKKVEMHLDNVDINSVHTGKIKFLDSSDSAIDSIEHYADGSYVVEVDEPAAYDKCMSATIDAAVKEIVDGMSKLDASEYLHSYYVQGSGVDNNALHVLDKEGVKPDSENKFTLTKETQNIKGTDTQKITSSKHSLVVAETRHNTYEGGKLTRELNSPTGKITNYLNIKDQITAEENQAELDISTTKETYNIGRYFTQIYNCTYISNKFGLALEAYVNQHSRVFSWERNILLGGNFEFHDATSCSDTRSIFTYYHGAFHALIANTIGRCSRIINLENRNLHLIKQAYDLDVKDKQPDNENQHTVTQKGTNQQYKVGKLDKADKEAIETWLGTISIA